MRNVIFIKLSLLLMVAAFVFVACDKEDVPKDIIVQDSSSQSQTVFADDVQGSSGVSFTTTGPWTSSISMVSLNAKSAQVKAGSDSPNWISISPDAGKAAGNYTIEISLIPNSTGADRTAVITISCGDSNITVTVTQKGIKEDGTVPTESFFELSMSDYGEVKPESNIGFVTGETRTITATVLPKDDTEKTIKWQTTDPKIASISPSGNTCIITAGNPGDAVITVSCIEYPDIKAKFTITVKEEEKPEMPEGYVSKINGITLAFNSNGAVTGRYWSDTDIYYYADYYTVEGGTIGSGGKLTKVNGKGRDMAYTMEHEYIYSNDTLKQVKYRIPEISYNYQLHNQWKDGNLAIATEVNVNNSYQTRVDLEYSNYEHQQGNLDINMYLIFVRGEEFNSTISPDYYAIFDNNLGARSKYLVSKASYSECPGTTFTATYERTFRYTFYNNGQVSAVYYTDKKANETTPHPERKLCDFYY